MSSNPKALSPLFVLLLVFFVASSHSFAQTGTLTIDAAHPSHPISPMLYGMMTEEINHAFDGGLYGELISNREFINDSANPVKWSEVNHGLASATVSLDTTQTSNSMQKASLLLNVASADANNMAGVANEGFWGLPVRPNTSYHAAIIAKAANGFTGPLTLTIESNDGSMVYAKSTIPALSGSWQKYAAVLTTGAVTPSENNRFVISVVSPGKVWFGFVSLFPPTYHGRANGTRVDLMEKMAALHPAFLRMPGGNYLEGGSIADRFDWKHTVGDITLRPGHHPGCWGYPSTDGLGLLEMLEWCEDLHMQPVLAVYGGMSLNQKGTATGPALQPYVQDALDEIEYVTGPKTSEWGARRAADGHPAPFPLQYVEVGNEDGFDHEHTYDARYTAFYDAIKAKYPALRIIATASVQSRTPDVMDDHYYRSVRDTEVDTHHYDSYDRKGPRIFVGEWATTVGSPTPNYDAALSDAAWMTGLERNSDLVVLESYAPLLVNVNRGASQWGTNLIGYDALNSFGSPSYYMLSMFAQNKGDVVLPTQVAEPGASDELAGTVGVGTWATQADYTDIKVSPADGSQPFSPDLTNVAQSCQLGTGQWSGANGTISQTSGATPSTAWISNPGWGDCTYTLRARKSGGAEGFLILFRVKDGKNFVMWNIGGWGDTRTSLEEHIDGQDHEIGPSTNFTVKTGQWYDLNLVLKGDTFKGYVDGVLVTAGNDRPLGSEHVFAEATRDLATGDIILKAVNTTDTPQPLDVNINTTSNVAHVARGLILVGDRSDQNTITDPTKIVPQPLLIDNASNKFTYSFPARSISVVRFKTK